MVNQAYQSSTRKKEKENEKGIKMSARVSEKSKGVSSERKRERKKEASSNELDEKRRTKRRDGGAWEGRGVWRNERSSNANIRGDRD